MPKITPAEALSRIQALWPDVTTIAQNGTGISCDPRPSAPMAAFGASPGIQIDWPEGVSQWPPKGAWRGAKPDDMLNPKKLKARARYEGGSPWREGTLEGMRSASFNRYIWVLDETECGSRAHYIQCQVWDESL